MVTVGGTASGVHEAFDLGIACSNQHVEEPINVVLVSGDWIFYAAGNRTEGGLVEDIMGPITGLIAVIEVSNIPMDEFESAPLL